MDEQGKRLSISAGVMLLLTSVFWLALTVALTYVAWQTPPMMNHHRWLATLSGVMGLMGAAGAMLALHDLGRRNRR